MDQGDRKVSGQTGRKINPTTIALIIAGVLSLLLVIYVLSPGGGDEDRLSDEVASSNAVASEPEERCAEQATYDLIKRELFRRAAVLRGSDQATYDSLAAHAVLRAETPILREHDEEVNRVTCSAYLALDLPPGVAVVGGRRTLNAEVGYTIQPAADGSGNALALTNADAIITPLATLSRTGQPAAGETPMTEPGLPPDELGPEPGTIQPAPPQQPPAPADDPEPTEPATARPSYNCNSARTRSEIAVCNNSGLAALDRQMAAQFGSAMSGASSSQRSLLNRTRDRFLRYRDGCRSDDCIADAYRGRMSEIRDIMSGSWRPPR